MGIVETVDLVHSLFQTSETVLHVHQLTIHSVDKLILRLDSFRNFSRTNLSHRLGNLIIWEFPPLDIHVFHSSI